jgi:hypothetical protein
MDPAAAIETLKFSTSPELEFSLAALSFPGPSARSAVCLHVVAALRPGEAVVLREQDC